MRTFKHSVAKVYCVVKSGKLEVDDQLITNTASIPVTSVTIEENGSGYFFVLDGTDAIDTIPIGFPLDTKNGTQLIVQSVNYISRAPINPMLSPFAAFDFNSRRSPQ